MSGIFTEVVQIIYNLSSNISNLIMSVIINTISL